MTTFTDQEQPQANVAQAQSEPITDNTKHDGLTTEIKRIPVPEHVEPEPEKRGFWSRFFRPYD